MITKWRTDPSTPITTFVVGVLGSDSTGQTIGAYDTPPYSMPWPWSTYAVAGSPSTVDPTCDQSLMWTATGGNPAKPCHIDLSNGNNFNAGALASAIASLRGKALGCTYAPTAPGQTIDPGKVNVIVTINGVPTTIPMHQRVGYVLDERPRTTTARGKVILIGVTCSDVSTSAMAKVEVVGASTVTK